MSAAASVAVVGVGTLLLPAPASALSKHAFSAQITGSGSNALANPSDVEVDQSSGDIYVTDEENHRVEKFTPSGEFILMFGKEVDATTGADLCTAASGDICQTGTAGLGPGAFTNPRYLAVDNSGGPSAGDVYVGDFGTDSQTGQVEKFDSSGHLIESWALGGILDGSNATDGSSFRGTNESGQGLIGVAVDPAGNLFVFANQKYFEFDQAGAFLTDFGTPEETFNPDQFSIVVDGEDSLYGFGANGLDKVFYGGKSFEKIASGGGGQIGLGIDPETRDLYLTLANGTVQQYAAGCTANCTPTDTFGSAHLLSPQGVAIDDASGIVYVANFRQVTAFEPIPYLPTPLATAAALTPNSERLSASVDPAGAGPVTSCRFDYGTGTSYNLGSIGCDPAVSPGSPITTKSQVEAASDLEGLAAGTTYHYRVVAGNATGTTLGFDRTFTTLPAKPRVEGEFVTEVHSDAAQVHAQVNPGGGESLFHTSYHLEYVTQAEFEASEFDHAEKTAPVDLGSARTPQPLSTRLSGLAPATEFVYRVIAENASGKTEGQVRTFTTLPFTAEIEDGCANAHVRQQTGAALLLDCRAYELVSAADTGGYDVESSLVFGQEPFAAYPLADGRVLYGVHAGGIPGTGDPTNRGVDPYLAVRGEDGWHTEYVGIPADGTPSALPFSSTLLAADPTLDTFAFGGREICSPCFAADGSTGIPLRMPDGKLEQGLAGPLSPGPTATANILVQKRFSDSGAHFLFGSTSQFTSDGSNNGDPSIYDRNLATDSTHDVSKLPDGENIPCLLNCLSDGVAELDISADGSRVLVGQLLSESAGAQYWHLYLDVDDSERSIDLTPGTTSGVLYDGMTSDASKVYFTTVDQLLPGDTDHSVDLYMWSQAGEEAGRPLTLISTGTAGTGNTDACSPVADPSGTHWNTLGSEANCGVVALGGGGGVASGDGTVYFLSPELLDGASNGVQNAPNLYVARPGGEPRFVTTLESSLNAPLPVKEHPFVHSFGSFTEPTGIALDPEGNSYVLSLEGTHAVVEKFSSAGNAVSGFANSGVLDGSAAPTGAFTAISGGGLELPAGIAVDTDPSSASYRDLYVPDFSHGVVDKFNSNGTYLSQLHVEDPTAVAVNPANGQVYVTDLLGPVAVFSAAGTGLSGFTALPFPTGIAVDSHGTVYVVNNQEADSYSASGAHITELDPNPAYGVAVDPENGHVLVDEGSQLIEFDSSGNQVGSLTGAERLSGSVSLAANSAGRIVVSNPGSKSVAEFGSVFPSGSEAGNPLVVDSVDSPASRETADFQITPSGDDAVFPSTLSLLQGQETAGHSEIYRYDATAARLDCVSCTLTGAAPSGAASLAPNGLNLSDDGRVFFTTAEQLVNNDTDNKRDAYEWAEPGLGDCTSASPTFNRAAGVCIALISAGTGSFDSVLLGASANGTDAYFFTRDNLSPADKNGATVKIYDAREAGGFPFVFPQVPCQASDECHGAGSPAPSPPQVGSVAGTPHNVQAEKPAAPKCKKGFVNKHGKCVKKPPSKHKRRHHKRVHRSKRGGAK